MGPKRQNHVPVLPIVGLNARRSWLFKAFEVPELFGEHHLRGLMTHFPVVQNRCKEHGLPSPKADFMTPALRNGPQESSPDSFRLKAANVEMLRASQISFLPAPAILKIST